MVDLVVMNSYGYHLGALRRWATGAEDLLCNAISDFPKRGILVCGWFYLQVYQGTQPYYFSAAPFQPGHGTWSAASQTDDGG